jgi:hypothetical protein
MAAANTGDWGATLAGLSVHAPPAGASVPALVEEFRRVSSME